MIELLQIQQLLRVGKTQKNNFANFNFRSCEDILQVAKPLAHERNCILTLDDEVVIIEGWHYKKATALLKNVLTGKKEKRCGLAREQEFKKGMDASQISGSTSSYARKLALGGLLCIDNSVDADCQDNTNIVIDSLTAKINWSKEQSDLVVIDQEVMKAFDEKAITDKQKTDLKALLNKKHLLLKPPSPTPENSNEAVKK